MATKTGKSTKSSKSKSQGNTARDRAYAKANRNGVRVIKGSK